MLLLGLVLAAVAAVLVSLVAGGKGPSGDTSAVMATVGEGVRTPFGVVAVERVTRGAGPERIEVTLSVVNLSQRARASTGPLVLRDQRGVARPPVETVDGTPTASAHTGARAILAFDVPPGSGAQVLEMQPAGMSSRILVDLGKVGELPRRRVRAGAHGH
jgi:hypothetical protein